MILLEAGRDPSVEFAVYAICVGGLLLAVSSFGREFGLKTFTMMLAQPLERRLIWRVKFTVLAAAMLAVSVVWALCCAAWLHGWNERVGRPLWLEVVPGGLVGMLAIIAGGLWTTLLFRQVAAAFWMTALIPVALATILSWTAHWASLVYPVLTVYAIGGLTFAWWQFYHAQEVGWTGGTIKWTARQPVAVSGGTAVRIRRPLAALLHKEFKLHQAALAGIVAFVVVHLWAVLVRDKSSSWGTANILDFMGALWVFVPLFVATMAVAEERRLGTLDALRCLPASSRRQFVVKLFFSLTFGGLLPALLLWTIEWVGLARGAPGSLDIVKTTSGNPASTLPGVLVVFLGLALAGFYASTTANGLLQAMAAMVATIVVIGVTRDFLVEITPRRLTGTLLPVIFWPVMAMMIFLAAKKNFATAYIGWRFWRRNLLGFAAAPIIALIATVSIHTRAWEFLMPLEPAHGPARLALADQSAVRASGIGPYRLALILPGGKLWVDAFRPTGWDVFPSITSRTGDHNLYINGPWITSGGGFLSGSNWKDALTTGRDLAAIRADGTLWVGEAPHAVIAWNNQSSLLRPLVRFGDQTGWKQVTYGFRTRFILLNQDGTLWQFENPPSAMGRTNNVRPALPDLALQRLVVLRYIPDAGGPEGDSDWASIESLPDIGQTLAWKNNGMAWRLYPVFASVGEPADIPVIMARREPALDHLVFKSLDCITPPSQASSFFSPPNPASNFLVTVRGDGTLWATVYEVKPGQGINSGTFMLPTRIGTDTNWSEVAAEGPGARNGNRFVALKTDGTIWEFGRGPAGWTGRKQLGSHSDWITLRDGAGVVALAADGGLWLWDGNNADDYSWEHFWLAPSRKPEFVGNIYAEKK